MTPDGTVSRRQLLVLIAKIILYIIYVYIVESLLMHALMRQKKESSLERRSVFFTRVLLTMSRYVDV